MPFKENVKQRKSKMNAMFGIITKEDLSDDERALYDKYAVKNENGTQRVPDSKEKMDALNQERNTLIDKKVHINDYIEELYDKKDENIVSSHARIAALNQERDAKRAEYNAMLPTLDQYKEKEREAYEAEMKALADFAEANTKLTESSKKFNYLNIHSSDLQKTADKRMKFAEEKKKEIELEIKETEDRIKSLRANVNALKGSKGWSLFSTSKLDYETERKIATLDGRVHEELSNEGDFKIALETYKNEILDAQKDMATAEVEKKEAQKLKNSYEKEQKNFDKVNAKHIATTKAYNAASNDTREYKKACDAKDQEFLDITKNLNDTIKGEKDYANLSLDTRLDEIRVEMDERKQADTIQTRLDNRNPLRTKDTISKGLAAVKMTYSEYKKSHSAIGRFFSFLPFTSAGKDYKEFSSLRDSYIENSGMNEKEVNRYLDKNELTGALKENVLPDIADIQSFKIDNEIPEKIEIDLGDKKELNEIECFKENDAPERVMENSKEL